MGNELTHEMTMTDFTPLDVDEMVTAYKHSKSRVILFDYGGSLLEKEVRLRFTEYDVTHGRSILFDGLASKGKSISSWVGGYLLYHVWGGQDNIYPFGRSDFQMS